MSAVRFFDCSVIGVFVGARNATRVHGGDPVLRSPSALGRRVLAIVGLSDLEMGAPRLWLTGRINEPILNTNVVGEDLGRATF